MTGTRKKRGEDHYTRDEGPCDNLTFETRIKSPPKDVISRLSKGDILMVALYDSRA